MQRPLGKDISKVMEWLAEKMCCPLCGCHYNLNHVRLVRRSAGVGHEALVHTGCERCESFLLFALDVKDGEVMLVGVVTDLTYSDAVYFGSVPSIAIDDVIDMHTAIEAFEGDFVKALRIPGIVRAA